MAGLPQAAMLITYFISATAISHLRKRTETDTVVAGVVEKGGPRDAFQVLANGGVFTGLTLVWTFFQPNPVWAVGAAGALAASAADTFATEIGTISKHPPRSILTGKPVLPGTSGGVSGLGSIGGVLGAGVVPLVASLFGAPLAPLVPIFVAGVLGMLIDSLLGGTIQAKRICPTCQLPTERAQHSCGTPTRLTGGVGYIDNDMVNLLTTSLAAVIAMSWFALSR
jgi:uncharacterized protein (TIGR00297 family)